MSTLFGTLEQTCSAAEQPEFVATQIHEANTPVYDLTWGDFDPCNVGMEVAYLASDGVVVQLSPGLPSWEVALRHDGETGIGGRLRCCTIAIGDVHSGYPGKEVVTCAGSYRTLITMVFRDPCLGWLHQTIFDNNGLVGQDWGARVGDYDPCHPGDEIFHIYEGTLDCSTGTIFSESEVNGEWVEEIIFGHGEMFEVGYDSAAGEFNPDHPGPEIVVATEGMNAYEILSPNSPESNNWPRRSIWTSDDAGSVVEIADVDPCHPGNEVVYGTGFKNRIMMSRHNGDEPHELEILFTGDANEFGHTTMLDIAIGNILPQMTGLEILGVDHTGSVYLVRKVDGSWQGQVIWQDPNSLYAVIAGDFLPARSGDEILVAGESGTITLLTLTFTDNLTGDGKVNFQDFAELANYWQQNEPSADIGPWPIGDGVVDMLDAAVLVEDWLQAAYWVE